MLWIRGQREKGIEGKGEFTLLGFALSVGFAPASGCPSRRCCLERFARYQGPMVGILRRHWSSRLWRRWGAMLWVIEGVGLGHWDRSETRSRRLGRWRSRSYPASGC